MYTIILYKVNFFLTFLKRNKKNQLVVYQSIQLMVGAIKKRISLSLVNEIIAMINDKLLY